MDKPRITREEAHAIFAAEDAARQEQYKDSLEPKQSSMGMNDIPTNEYRANWTRHGRAAGPIRNKQMLEDGKPHVIIAFSNDLKNSKGTSNMVEIAQAAGIPTIVIKE